MQARTRIATSLAALSILSGCGILPGDRQDRLVSTHLAVLSVEDFNAAKRKLSPSFKLTGDEALKLVNPTIGARIESQLDSIRTSGELGLDITPTGTGTGDASPPALPGTAPAGAKFSSPQNFKDVLDQASSLRTSRGLEYQLAQSLFEQVAMLNATVAAASVPRGYTGYVVQLQLGIMPRMQNLPRDVYADISFFAVTKDAPTDRLQRSLDQAALMGSQARNLDSSTRRIRVVPLLSTDSLESVANSASVEQLRAFSGGLRLAASRVSAGASVERVLQDLEASLGKRLMSSYSVARLSENSLRARFGAVPTGSGLNSVVPRTHKLPVLILLPEGLERELLTSGTKIELLASAKTTLIDPETGVESKPVEFDEFLREGTSKLAPYFAVPGGKTLLQAEDTSRILRIAVMAQENDYERFLAGINSLCAELRKRLPRDPQLPIVAELTPETVWIEMLGITTRTQYSGARFTIAKPASAPLRLPESVFALDDGKTWSITLAGVPADRIKPDQVQLVVSELGDKKFNPESIGEGAGGAAKLSFPTFKSPKGPVVLALDLKPEDVLNGSKPGAIPVQRISVKPPPSNPVAMLTRSTQFINVANGKGVVVLAVNFAAMADLPLPKVRLKIDGGAFVELSAVSAPDAAVLKDGAIECTKSVTVTATVTGVSGAKDVAVTVVDADERPLDVEGSELKFRVQ
ncbi:MAG: hypothetical protein IT432_12150 [Phycisphaerales bacterium]|nr:hypothetical protein [Phycisphaerales bacterium]